MNRSTESKETRVCAEQILKVMLAPIIKVFISVEWKLINYDMIESQI